MLFVLTPMLSWGSQVVTFESGFGRMGAWLARNSTEIYSIRRGVRKHCFPANADSLSFTATHAIGL